MDSTVKYNKKITKKTVLTTMELVCWGDGNGMVNLAALEFNYKFSDFVFKRKSTGHRGNAT